MPFRHLTSLYETHVTHTPMILAEEFSRAQTARVSDFSTSRNERGVFWLQPASGSRQALLDLSEPLPPSTEGPVERIELESHYVPRAGDRLPAGKGGKDARLVRGALVAQLASPNGASLADAAELLAPHVDGIDLNCGCPQRWAYAEGIGCALLRKPELVADMVRAVKDRLGWSYPISVKIRVDPELGRTHTLVRNAVAAGASYVTVHGRTRHQASTEPVDLSAIRFAVECAQGDVPTVGNGDIWAYGDALEMRAKTGVNGVMAARGLLANPALFAGYDRTPHHAVAHFVNLATDYGFIHSLLHRHVAYMLEDRLSRPEKVWFNSLGSSVQVVEYLQARGLDFAAQRAANDAVMGYRL